MTKLNVVIPAVNVMVGETTYRKVDRKAQAGDIVKVTGGGFPDVETGAFYTVESGLSRGYSVDSIVDDDGVFRWGALSRGAYWEVYEAVTPVSSAIPAEATAVITFDGAQYRKVDRSAREGDVIILRSAPFEEYDITQGTPYEVTRVDSSDDPHIKDDEGGDYDTCDDVFDVYEKVSAETTVRGVQYLEVKRQARAGETIKMMDDDGADGWAEGDTFIVAKIDSDGDAVFKDNDGDTRYKDTDYYVVLEPINAQAKAEPERLSVGDYAKVVNPKAYREHRRGQIVEIFEDVHDRQPFKARSLTDGGDNWYCEHELTLATAEEVRAAQAKAQRVAQRKIAIGPFADGGFAQIVNADKGNASPTAIHHPSAYVKVTVEPAGRVRALKLLDTDGGCVGYCNADALRQITVAEYDAAVAPEPKFSVGDTVKLTVAAGEKPCYGWGSVSNGDTGKVTKVFGASLRVDFPKQRGWDAKSSELTKLSVEEATAIEKEAQEIAKWEAIGRKVGELKSGDFVKVERTCSAPLNVGEVLSVISDSSVSSARVTGGWRVVATLIVPVEQRFDTAESAAQSA
ncbi:hypothetical protein MKY63_00885 [Paenibacillus sp. FSL R7-0189]|uniref:hypothetical protein n=1 Tax=Paenibacillus sp. FSL R7-0189 TaxID=2921673 RepID=UPI0030D725CC